MAHIVSIINGKEPNGSNGGVTDKDLSSIAVDFLTAGVVGADDYKVEQQSTPNMTVKVGTGKAYVANPAGTMKYRTELDAVDSAAIASNASGNPRVDAVVIKVDASATPNEFANNVASLVVVQGAPAASPTAPIDSAIQTAVGAGNAFYRIGNVTVANGATSITDANIASTRDTVQLSDTLTPDTGYPATHVQFTDPAEYFASGFTTPTDVKEYNPGLSVTVPTGETHRYLINAAGLFKYNYAERNGSQTDFYLALTAFLRNGAGGTSLFNRLVTAAGYRLSWSANGGNSYWICPWFFSSIVAFPAGTYSIRFALNGHSDSSMNVGRTSGFSFDAIRVS